MGGFEFLFIVIIAIPLALVFWKLFEKLLNWFVK